MTKLQAIFVAIIIFVFGWFSHCVFTPIQKSEIKIDSTDIKYNIRMDSFGRAISDLNKQISGVESRTVLLYDSLKNNDKKINEEKKVTYHFTVDSRTRWRDSIERTIK